MSRIYPVLLAALLTSPSPAPASTISLTEPQRARLVKLLASEPEVKKLFRKLKREADGCVHDQAKPIVQLATAGRLDTDPLKVRSRESLVDMKKLHALGYAYAVTSNSAYSGAARRLILRWAEINQPTGLPIDETKLEPLFVAYDLTRSTYSEADRIVVETWLRKMAMRELQTAQTHSVTAMNNWNSHRLKIIGLIGFLLEDKNLIDQAVQGFQKQIQVNLHPDGSSFDFQERDALHYHCYDLEPLLALAIAAHQNGIDLYNYQAPGGASLSKSVDFLLPYYNGARSHPEWVHSKVAFDRKRAQAGEKGFSPGTPFNPREAKGILELASFFDDRYRPLVLQLADKRTVEYPTWQTVLNKVNR